MGDLVICMAGVQHSIDIVGWIDQARVPLNDELLAEACCNGMTQLWRVTLAFLSFASHQWDVAVATNTVHLQASSDDR